MLGVINFYKEGGVTSFRAVAIVRRLLGIKKCGHLGTLDPIAEGVLPIMVGSGTRFADYLSSSTERFPNGKSGSYKEYIASLELGYRTDSYDYTGSKLEESDIKPSNLEIEEVLTGFKGSVELKVPAFSAKKIDGVRAYTLARKGKIEDAGTSIMHIEDIELLEYDYPLARIRVECSKGTYIRSIINELGLRLGCFATMACLIRTASGGFSIEGALKASELEAMVRDGKNIITRVDALLQWQSAVVKDEYIKNIKNGLSLKLHYYDKIDLEKIKASNSPFVFIKDRKDNLLAVAEMGGEEDIPLLLKMVFIK